MLKRNTILLFILFVPVICFSQAKFTNPVLDSGPDRWVVQKNDRYYFLSTTGNSILIRSTTDLTGLRNAVTEKVYTPPETGPYSKQFWAPEMHFLREKWYVYFAADDGDNKNHRIYVIENEHADPMQGEWIFKGKLTDPGDHWAIDLTVTEINNRLYASWSGWDGDINGMQRLYIAELSDPWTMKGDRVEIAKPTYAWELHGSTPEAWQKNGEVPEVLVNEGPEFLIRNGKVFIVYSANACWLDYCLGLLEAKPGADLLDSGSWKKYDQPVFTQSVKNSVFAPGRNGFFKSPDGKEDWIIYHANKNANDGCGNKRAPYLQPFRWKKDGTPDFGEPLPRKQMRKPSGTKNN